MQYACRDVTDVEPVTTDTRQVSGSMNELHNYDTERLIVDEQQW